MDTTTVLSCVGKPQYTLDYVMAQKNRADERVPGACLVRHDQSIEKWRLQIQLDDEHLWYLSVFVCDDGRLEKFSLDKEAADDSHYEFSEEQKIRDSMYISGDENKYFHEVLMRFVKRHGGAALLNAIMPYVTNQFHYC